MKLAKLVEGLNYKGNIDDREILDIAYDSRKANKDTAFVALVGANADGHKFIKSAYENGCRVFFTERECDIPQDAIEIITDNTRATLAKISANLFENPSDELKIIGVTGTKGKSTIVYLMRGILKEAGINCGIIGTNGIEYCGIKEKTVNTTPESYELQKSFRKMVDNGVKAVVMEVSSQGLKMNRVDHISFDVGIFTNISPDHIGPTEHKDMDEYIFCKSKLFKLCKIGVFNIDDAEYEKISKDATCKKITFSQKGNADIVAKNLMLWQSSNMLGVKFDAYEGDESYEVKLCQPGRFSTYNGLAVLGAGKALKIPRDKILSALAKTTVEGRAELIPLFKDVKVVIDYAHNKLSLENILTALREYNPKRIICVIGSVGGRTELRRAQLGEVASLYSDVCILTSDNPDFEDPTKIARDMHDGFVKNIEYYIIPDRTEAIKYAMNIASSGDLVALCGKGHEDYQLINGEKVHFSEKEVLEEIAKSR
jgi:UDP-N-acetylmuramoyl-L-alanyl-D-glutamate--2,6-diaminopimelate ligase